MPRAGLVASTSEERTLSRAQVGPDSDNDSPSGAALARVAAATVLLRPEDLGIGSDVDLAHGDHRIIRVEVHCPCSLQGLCRGQESLQVDRAALQRLLLLLEFQQASVLVMGGRILT